MNTVAQSIYNVRAMLKAYTDDFKPTNRFIYSYLKSSRILILKAENEKGNLFNSSAYQIVKYFPFEPVDIADYCDVNINITIYKSKFQIPKPINTNTGKPICKIYTLDRGNIINISNQDTIIGGINRKHKYPISDAFIENDYLFTLNQIDAARLAGVFEDPIEVEILNDCRTFNNCGTETTDTCPVPILEKPFNVPGNISSVIEKKTAIDIATFYGVSVEDKNNNASNDNPPNGVRPMKTNEN